MEGLLELHEDVPKSLEEVVGTGGAPKLADAPGGAEKGYLPGSPKGIGEGQ